VSCILVRLWLRHSALDIDQRHRMRQFVNSGGLLIVLFLIAIIWASVLQGVGFALAAFAVAFVLSFKEIITSLLGWFHRTITQSFHIGDRIEVDDYRGDVVAVGFLSTTLLEVNKVRGQSTGRLLAVPNHLLLSKPVVNMTRSGGYRWVEVSIKPRKGDPLKDHEQALLDAAAPLYQEFGETIRKCIQELQEDLALKTEELEPKVYLAQEEKELRLALRMAVPPRRYREAIDQVLRKYYERYPPNANASDTATEKNEETEKGEEG